MKRNLQAQKTVYNFTALTRMKFKSPVKQTQSQIKTPSVLNRIKSISWLGGKKRSSEKSIPDNATNPESTEKTQLFPSPIQFIKKLTNDHFLVGNQYHIDVIGLGNILGDFIDTEDIWSLNFKKSILNIAVDLKKFFLAFLTGNQVEVYEYNIKKSKEAPKLMTTLKTSGEVRFIQFAKDSHLALFYSDNIEIFYIDQTLKTAKKKYSKPYSQPKEAILLQVPQAFEGVINIFFQEPRQDASVFHLWNLQIRLQRDEIKMSKVLKIYDIPNRLKSKIVLSNYSKQIFCMNLGHQILAVKKGYIIDTVNSNIQSEGAVLRYLGNDRLIHITKHKIQMYRFSVNGALNPPRIILESTDSIYSKINDDNYVFLDILEMVNQNIVVFYQIKEDKNNSLSGQVKYVFAVTQKVKFQDKIREILPSPEDLLKYKQNPQKTISQQNYEVIQEKCDMAVKMGLTRKQIYLRLWNNSTKCDVADYQFLLDTMDYDTIRNEIQTKLKKKSMVLRQVIKIQQGCISMLQKLTFSPQASNQNLKNFLISHFLIRKLKLYQLFNIIEKADSKMRKSRIVSSEHQKQDQTIMINIKDYLSYAKCDLKAILLELVRDFCHNKKNTILKIRTLIKVFRFSFRPIYTPLIEEIIKQAGLKLLYLLQAIPQILPYEPKFDQQPADSTLYQGVWGNILPEQWELNLYAGGISTIDNKDIVQEMVKSVWAKRFFLSLHDLLPYSRTEILNIHQNNKAEQTFYNFIQKVFLNIAQQSILQDLMKFIQTQYAHLPQHLIGQIFLYKKLFDYLKAQNALKNRLPKGDFNQFLKLKDFQICKLIFDLEKIKKNCILKDVKRDIYNHPSIHAGNDLFNLALLNFFSSELSQISDIKYLLNRLNNEKYQFHSQNQGMYEVIVKGMQAKLYLGSDHDIPIDEVYIYISNIHIEQDSQIKKDLKYLNIINKYSEKFRHIKINMSVFQMIRQVQKVLSLVVNFEVQDSKILQRTEDDQILKETLKILQTVESIKSDIYFEAELKNELVFFIFITRILQNVDFIQRTHIILKSTQLALKYHFNELFIENAVLYMYKKKFSQNKIYRKNQEYISKLILLLPEQNQTRTFISYELQLGITLSCDGNELQYPLGGSNGVLSTVELETAINFLPGDAVKAIDFDRIYQIALKMQQISSDGQISSISLYQIYEIVILRLLQCKLVKQSIIIMRKIMQLSPESPYNFIYPVLLIKKFSAELCDQNRAILLLILSYQYNNSGELISIVEKLLNSKSTSLEQKITLRAQLNRIQSSRTNYSKNNQIFDPDYIQALKSQKQQRSFVYILRKCLSKILQIKDQFLRNPQYPIIFTILCNNPYAIVKYLYCSRYQSNFKGIRCFFSHLIKEQVFNRSFILQLGKRIFKILHEGLSQTVYIENIIERYKKIPLCDSIDMKKIKPDSNLSIVMSKSVQRFKNKIKEDMNSSKKKKTIQQTHQQRKTRIQNKVSNSSHETDQFTNQYPFQDSDNELAGNQTKLKKIITNQSTKVNFDSVFERLLMMNRTDKTLGMYLSQEFSAKEKQMFYSKKIQQLQIKNSVIKLKNKKKQLEEGYSMRLSDRFPSKNITNSNYSDNGIDMNVEVRIPIKSTLKQTFSMDLTESVRGLQIQAAKHEQQPLLLIEQEPTINYDLVIDKIINSSEGQKYNVAAFDQTTFDQAQFKEFIKRVYTTDKLSLNQSLGIIKKLNQKPHIAPINSQYLEIYLKMQHFQKKFNLDIDLKVMFPIEGIFIQSKNLSDLFNFVKDKTTEMLTDNNVYKITKVMSLVFKNNDIEQELNIAFLIKFLKEFQNSNLTNLKEVSMQKQKIKAFTEKISIHHLNLKDQQILNQISKPQLKNFMVQVIIEAMRKRKNDSMAQSFQKKWSS